MTVVWGTVCFQVSRDCACGREALWGVGDGGEDPDRGLEKNKTEKSSTQTIKTSRRVGAEDERAMQWLVTFVTE